MAKKVSAKEMITKWPGRFERREKYIIALCQGSSIDFQNLRIDPDLIGGYIVAVANKILEESEQ